MDETLRIGVIGLGAQGVQHMWGIGRIEGARLAAVVDVDAQRASRVASEKGVPGFSDLDADIGSDGSDVRLADTPSADTVPASDISPA